jgi:hypothetical protein
VRSGRCGYSDLPCSWLHIQRNKYDRDRQVRRQPIPQVPNSHLEKLLVPVGCTT